jgi:tetratricopeptide (TPR) repeat protein
MANDGVVQTRMPIALAAAILLISFRPAQGHTAPPWLDRFKGAQSQLQRGDLPGATQRFDELWGAFPRDATLAFSIASALDSSGHHREATEWYVRSLKLNPRFPQAYNNLALNYASLGDFQRAIPALRRATDLDPNNARTIYNLGLIHLRLHHFEQAAQAFGRAHELNPVDSDPLTRLAYASFRCGKRREGLRAVEELLGLRSDRKQSTVTAVKLLNGAGLYKEALAHARAAEESGAASGLLLYEEATSLFHLANYPQAVAILRKIGPPSEGSLDYYLLLGSAEALSGDLPSAIQTLQTAVHIAPDRPEPYYRLGLVFLEGYRDQDAREVLSSGLKTVPNSPLLLFALGAVDEISGNERKAIENLQKSLSIKPQQPEAWELLGDLDLRLGRLGQAGEAYRKAIALGSPPETTVKYADLLLRLREYSEAEKLLRQLLKRDSRLGIAYVSLGKLFDSRKQYKQADAALRHAIELDPDNPQAHLFLAEALQHLGEPEQAEQERALAAKKKEEPRESTRLLRRVLVPAGSED